ncbi:cilia- and flagella-associated protein 44 [Drosophila sulfurigaster albostrigata]|uniref:cilia- and flagella-associated protein 44 n=1 Tax=Drosophila sulfurigaster albostrigata TaxID=89887 RepID=UPI002D21B53E|nr:cilia- and flagella-associated protein 44 [Drosophila sulfurigaster albostrigata]
MDSSLGDNVELMGEEEDLGDDDYGISFTQQIIELKHSFGYDCKRLFNLVLLDDDTLIFVSGNFLHYFSISRREVTFRETVFGCGIGFITKNEQPQYKDLFTVGENGPKPTIFIYEYPSHDVRIKLTGAAKSCFTAGSYNSSGELFASQAGYPDFIITIWRWERAEVVLRAKSFQSNILFVHFSEYNPILLCSSGLSHIKFWKMANTFTGLKLKGDLGRFGKTDFSDISAMYMLPDENVISGCDWGNMLLWEAGLIKFEICRKGRKPCHLKPITRITMKNGEVTTVGMDGYVRVWYWETVDIADPPEDDLFVEIDPIYEFKISEVEIRAMQKIKPFEEKDFGYYAQDGSGGIWFCDINTYDVPRQPKQLYSCVGGRVLAAQMSPVSPHMLALSETGKIFVYDYEEKRLLLEKQFAANGVDILWMDTQISKFGTEMVAGFEDGILRHIFLDLSDPKKASMHLVNAFKAHTAPITRLTINRSSSLLLTGSADKSMFIYCLSNNASNSLVKLQPLGFVEFKAVPNCFYWHEEQDSVVLIGCKSGEVYEYNIRTNVSDEETYLSYNITDATRLRSTRFVSVKSRIRRELRREKIKKRKEKKRERKMREIEKLKKANPGLQIDMESALADSEPDEEEEPLHVPSIPNRIIWLRYTERNTIWVSMAGYDAGYIYELEFDVPEPSFCTLITDADDIEIHSYLIVDEFILFGMMNGSLRINHFNPENFTDLADYRHYPMHDALKGIIPCIMSSYDGKHLVSVGYDGNVFLYNWNGPKVVRHSLMKSLPHMPSIGPVEDIIDPETPSLEQEKINAELKRQQEAAEAHDRDVLAKIGALQSVYFEIVRRNDELPAGLRVHDKDLLLDPRITQQIRDELQAELDDVREDLAYDLEFAQVGHSKLYNHFLKKLDHVPFTITPLCANIEPVSTFRLETLGEEFQQIKLDIEDRLKREQDMRLTEVIAYEEKEDSITGPPPETFFFGRDPKSITPRFSRKMMRLLQRYRKRQLYEVRRIFDWDKLERQKPDPNRNHPEDDAKIAEAQRNLGDYKLKINSDYEPKTTETLTAKYIEIVECREQYFEMLDAFNQRVMLMRDQKKDLMELIQKQRDRLERIHEYLPEVNRLQLKHINEIDLEMEYPELNLIEHHLPGCGANVDDILYLEATVDEVINSKKPKRTVDNISLYEMAALDNPDMQEVVKFKTLQISKLSSTLPPEELVAFIGKLPPASELAYYELDEEGNAPFTLEMRHRWLRLLTVEQLLIIAHVDEQVRLFDLQMEKLHVARFHTKLNAEFLTAFMISLNQELYILRDSEQIESQLLQNAKHAMGTRNELQVIINATNRQLDELRKAIDKINEQISGLQVAFMTAIKGHKFYDFLRRIFKKKWRPPKRVRGDDEESSSSSSSSSSSEDEGADAQSVDSLDMTTIRLDEATCPTGLERQLYEWSFVMRADRHALERTLLENQADVERKRREIAEMQTKMKYHEEVYQREKNTLLQFRRNRQQEINKVQVSTVLRMDQLQHFHEGHDFRDVSQAILFDADMLIDLRRRAEKLHEETQATKRWHRINFVHLRRMNRDIKFMRFEITRLEEEIKQAQMKRFGVIINLDELEEEVLRRYVFELETTAEDEMRALEKELQERKIELSRCEEQMVQETQTNTEKVNLQTVLLEQKNVLDNILDVQERNYEKWANPQVLNLNYDIEKLMGIENALLQQIESLEREICTLRLKAKPLQINELDPIQQLQQQQQQQQPVLNELTPMPAEAEICPAILNVEAYMLPPMPDDFIMDRVHTLVQKTFNQFFGRHTTPDHVRRFAQRSSLYLCQAAYSFQGRYTDRIAECITEHLESIVPKKYLIHMSAEEMRKLFQEVVAVFDYERSDVNTEELISGIFEHAKEALCTKGICEVVNRTQFIVLHMFKELAEVLPLEEFQADETVRMIVDVLEREPMADPRAINVDELVSSTLQHAQENLLDNVTALPLAQVGSKIQKALLKRRQYKTPNCQSPLSVRIASKKPSAKTGLPF